MDYERLGVDRVFQSSTNLGVYGRFAAGLLARTHYVAIFDDDTIPGRRYLENCLETMRTHPGILVGAGTQFTSASYLPRERYGWQGRTSNVAEVDCGGSSWFLERAWLAYLWLEPPFNWDNGEDLRLSYLAQKYGGIRTYTPAQAEDEMCGSLLLALGRDEVALSAKPDHYRLRSEQLVEQLKNGWRTVRGIQL
jgi:hypothetical protein